MFASALTASTQASTIYAKKRAKLRKDISKLINKSMKAGQSVISIKTDIYDAATRDELRELGYICDIYGKCIDCGTRYDESHDEDDDEIDHSIFKLNKCLHKEHEAYYKIVVAFSIINGDPSKTLDEPCPICYEQIYSNIQQYATCSQCKKSIHRVNCLQKLKTPKCPCCRAIDVFVINYPNVVF